MTRTCIITGANAGIGKRAAIQLLRSGCRVVIVARSQERGEGALREIQGMDSRFQVELQVVDVGVMDSVRQLANTLKGSLSKVDVLINNAAVFDVTRKRPVETGNSIP